jgi:hypothetical protein
MEGIASSSAADAAQLSEKRGYDYWRQGTLE